MVESTEDKRMGPQAYENGQPLEARNRPQVAVIKEMGTPVPTVTRS